MNAPRYYAVTVPVSEPLSSYTEAMKVHADRLARGDRFIEGEKPTVLLDLSSISELDEPGFRRLLMDDPVLHALYTMGRQHGRDDAKFDEL